MNDMTNVTANETEALSADVMPAMVPEKYVAALFDPFKKKFNAAKRAAGKVEAYDITTTAGMGQAKELRASFRDLRTSLENERKARKAPIISAGKLLDARAAELTAEIEPFESKYDSEIKAEEGRKAAEKARKEAEERARVEAIEGRIAHIRSVPGQMAAADSEAIRKEIDQWTMLRLDPDDYSEYLEDGMRAVSTTVDQLGALLAGAEAREAEQRRIASEREELARLRAEQEVRDRAQREADAERERVSAAERRAAEQRQALADAAFAEQQRQMQKMQADQARTMRIMQDIQAISLRTSAQGGARELLDELEAVRGIVVDEVAFGDMVDMAQMAKEMAINQLHGKYTLTLAEELPDAHAEALEMEAERIDLAAKGVRLDLATGARFSMTTMKENGEGIMLNKDGTRSVFCDLDDNMDDAPVPGTTEPQYHRPEDGEILDVLAAHYDESPAVLIGWLRELVASLDENL